MVLVFKDKNGETRYNIREEANSILNMCDDIERDILISQSCENIRLNFKKLSKDKKEKLVISLKRIVGIN